MRVKNLTTSGSSLIHDGHNVRTNNQFYDRSTYSPRFSGGWDAVAISNNVLESQTTTNTNNTMAPYTDSSTEVNNQSLESVFTHEGKQFTIGTAQKYNEVAFHDVTKFNPEKYITEDDYNISTLDFNSEFYVNETQNVKNEIIDIFDTRDEIALSNIEGKFKYRGLKALLQHGGTDLKNSSNIITQIISGSGNEGHICPFVETIQQSSINPFSVPFFGDNCKSTVVFNDTTKTELLFGNVSGSIRSSMLTRTGSSGLQYLSNNNIRSAGTGHTFIGAQKYYNKGIDSVTYGGLIRQGIARTSRVQPTPTPDKFYVIGLLADVNYIWPFDYDATYTADYKDEVGVEGTDHPVNLTKQGTAFSDTSDHVSSLGTINQTTALSTSDKHYASTNVQLGTDDCFVEVVFSATPSTSGNWVQSIWQHGTYNGSGMGKLVYWDVSDSCWFYNSGTTQLVEIPDLTAAQIATATYVACYYDRSETTLHVYYDNDSVSGTVSVGSYNPTIGKQTLYFGVHSTHRNIVAKYYYAAASPETLTETHRNNMIASLIYGL